MAGLCVALRRKCKNFSIMVTEEAKLSLKSSPCISVKDIKGNYFTAVIIFTPTVSGPTLPIHYHSCVTMVPYTLSDRFIRNTFIIFMTFLCRK